MKNLQLSPVAAACALFVSALAGSAQAQTSGEQAAAPMATVTVSGIRRGIEDAISVKKKRPPSLKRFPPKTSASCRTCRSPSRSPACQAWPPSA